MGLNRRWPFLTPIIFKKEKTDIIKMNSFWRVKDSFMLIQVLFLKRGLKLTCTFSSSVWEIVDLSRSVAHWTSIGLEMIRTLTLTWTLTYLQSETSSHKSVWWKLALALVFKKTLFLIKLFKRLQKKQSIYWKYKVISSKINFSLYPNIYGLIDRLLVFAFDLTCIKFDSFGWTLWC